MRFGHKLTLALVCVLALVLSLTTVWTQERQFDRALGDARAAAQDAWQREAGDLQQAMLPDGGTTPESLAWRYVTAPALLGSGARRVAVYGGDGGLLASNLPVTMDTAEAERARPEGGELRTVTAAAMDGARYLLCGGLVVTPGDTLTLVYAHPLDELFAARGVRLRDALLAQSAALAVAAALALALCRRLVRPLEELEAASRQIAAGAYDRHTALRGGDEVASLSRSFDGMAAAVQDAVGLGDVVQHGAGAHSGHIDREPGRAGPLGQLGGDMGHHARMGADIVQHAIFVPKGHAGGIVGDAALRGGLQGRFGQAGQRVHQRPFAVFRRADDGSGCGEDGHGGSMPPARGEGNVKEVRRCGRRRMDAAPCRDRAA